MSEGLSDMGAMDSRVGAYVVVIEQGRVLLVHGVEPFSIWILPGGGIEFSETAEECAVREVLEETGLVVEIDRILGVLDAYIPKEQRLSAGDKPLHLHQVFYEGHVVGGELIPTSDEGNDRAEWVPLTHVQHLARIPGVDVALELARNGPDGNDPDAAQPAHRGH
jgi:8-oxo-dGTP diphosphatase